MAGRHGMTRVLVAAAAALLTAGCTATVTPTPARPSLPVLSTAGWTGIEPASLSFGGANDVTVDSIVWQSWGQYQAKGYGATQVDDCIPDCAAATPYQAAVFLLLSQPVDGHFTVLSETTDTTPAAGPVVVTYGSPGWPVGTATEKIKPGVP
jgi:hypothetical protein